jgi:hypothetical protein
MQRELSLTARATEQHRAFLQRFCLSLRNLCAFAPLRWILTLDAIALVNKLMRGIQDCSSYNPSLNPTLATSSPDSIPRISCSP